MHGADRGRTRTDRAARRASVISRAACFRSRTSWAVAPAAAICPEWSTLGRALARRGLSQRHEARDRGVGRHGGRPMASTVEVRRVQPVTRGVRNRTLVRCSATLLLVLDEQVHVADERGVGEQVQREQRHRARERARRRGCPPRRPPSTSSTSRRRFCAGSCVGAAATRPARRSAVRGDSGRGRLRCVPLVRPSMAQPVVEVADGVGSRPGCYEPAGSVGCRNATHARPRIKMTATVNARPVFVRSVATYQALQEALRIPFTSRSPSGHLAFSNAAP